MIRDVNFNFKKRELTNYVHVRKFRYRADTIRHVVLSWSKILADVRMFQKKLSRLNCLVVRYHLLSM